jgi:hypothetical protein
MIINIFAIIGIIFTWLLFCFIIALPIGALLAKKDRAEAQCLKKHSDKT